MEAVKLFTCQTFESGWITVINPLIPGTELRQRDPMSLRSCERSALPKLVQHDKPPAPMRRSVFSGGCSRRCPARGQNEVPGRFKVTLRTMINDYLHPSDLVSPR